MNEDRARAFSPAEEARAPLEPLRARAGWSRKKRDRARHEKNVAGWRPLVVAARRRLRHTRLLSSVSRATLRARGIDKTPQRSVPRASAL